MADSENSKKSAGPAGGPGLPAFNQTGREETTTTIIRPKSDRKRQQRNILLTVIIVFTFFVAASIAFERSGLTWDEIFNENTGPSFGNPQRQENFNEN